MKPFKRKRRVTGYSLFVQESLKGCGLRIGSDAYREKLRKVSSSWNDLSQDRRDSFDARAMQQQTVRDSMSVETLPSGSTSSDLTLVSFFSVLNWSSEISVLPALEGMINYQGSSSTLNDVLWTTFCQVKVDGFPRL